MGRNSLPYFFFFITLGLELSDPKVYEPQTQALLRIASHYCGAVVLESGTAPFVHQHVEADVRQILALAFRQTSLYIHI
jgi:hypothetical protein